MNMTYMKSLVAVVAAMFCLSSFADESKPDLAIMNANWNAAFNSQDAAKLATLYTQSGSLSPGNQQVLVGREAIQGLFQSFFDAGVHDHTIEVISSHVQGDLAYQTSNWSAKGAANKEGVKAELGGVFTSVLQRQEDGSWKSMMHIWN